MRNWFIVAAAAALVAGCAGSGGSTSELAYEGDEAGTERETMRCAGDARLWGDIDVGSGMVTVVVRDERNETVFVRTFTGPGSLDEPRIEVEGETVTVEVHRYKMAEDATDGAANGTLPAGADWQQRPDRFTANQTNSPLGGGPQVDDSPQGRWEGGGSGTGSAGGPRTSSGQGVLDGMEALEDGGQQGGNSTAAGFRGSYRLNLDC